MVIPMHGQMDGQIPPCVLRDFVPFGTTAMALSLNITHKLVKQGTGAAGHTLPLGLYSFYCLHSGRVQL